MHEDEVFGIRKNDVETHACISANMRSKCNLDKDTAWILKCILVFGFLLCHEKYSKRRVVGLYVWVLVVKCMCMCANVNLRMLRESIGDR